MNDAPLTPDPWLTVHGAAAHSLTSESTILREARAGRLVGFKIGRRRCWRFRESAVNAWIESGTPEHAERTRLRLLTRP
jgi:excisionase family DNA binding protein